MSTQWIKAIARADVPEEDVIAVLAGDREIALYGVDGEVYATANLCTHGNARLCDGFLEGHEIECPLHQGRFDVRDGKALCSPLRENVATYAVRIEDGMVFVAL
jgi:naphthalene 1,2-dioxygenase system ferredoxin subunit